jgi:hypothetical protein
MIAETTRSSMAAQDVPPPEVTVPVEVQVTYNPVGDPTFVFFGLDTNNSVWILAQLADFVLTLSPVGFVDQIVTFAPIDPQAPGPITWLTPGSGVPIVRPAYVSAPLLSPDGTVVTFTDTNMAQGQHDLVSFAVNIVVTSLTGDVVLVATSHTPYSSPDPTIINVDPPGGGDAPGPV